MLEKDERVVLGKKRKRGKRYSLEELLEYHSPPCIKAIWEKFKARIEVDHHPRLVWYLMHRGYPKEDVMKLFELLPDYDEEYTEYQLEFAYRKRYRMASCKKMREWGLCIADCRVKSPLFWRG